MKFLKYSAPFQEQLVSPIFMYSGTRAVTDSQLYLWFQEGEYYYFIHLNSSGKFTVIIQSKDIPEHDDYYFGQFICNVPCPRMTNSQIV